MSEWPVDQPTGEVLRPLPLPAGHPPQDQPPPVSPTAPLSSPSAGSCRVAARPGSMYARGWRLPPVEEREAFITRHRRLARSFDRHGMLGRFDPIDDPSQSAELFERVVDQDTSRLTDGGWLDRLEAITRLEARLAAHKARAIAAFDDTLHGISADLGHETPEPGDRGATAGERRWHTGQLRSVSDEIGLVLNLHRGAATRRIQQSWELVHNHQPTLAALAEGDLTERAAFTIVDELSALQDPAHIQAAEAAVLDWARKHPLQRIKQAARREAVRLDPSVNDRRHKRALRDRQVRMISNDDATADLIINHNATDAAAAMTSLTKAAIRARRHGDTRTLDQLRADIALHRLISHPTGTGEATGDTANSRTGAAGENGGTSGHSATGENGGTSGDSGPSAASENGGTSGDSGHSAASENGGTGGDEGGDCTRPDRHTDVVIHATGEEIRALLTGIPGTGGDIDNYGPLPQNALRQALLNALRIRLTDNQPPDPEPPGPIPHDPPPDEPTPHDPGPHEPGPGGPGGPGPHEPGPHGPAAPDAAAGPTTGAGPSTETDAGPSGSATPVIAPARLSPAQSRRAAACYVTAPAGAIHLQLIDQPPPSNPRKYTPSDSLAHYIRRRDRTCQFPGCNRPAIHTDLDHRHPFDAGGETTADNLLCLCRHHHRLKHRGNWTIRPNPDGSHTWTSPTGRTYRTEPPYP